MQEQASGKQIVGDVVDAERGADDAANEEGCPKGKDALVKSSDAPYDRLGCATRSTRYLPSPLEVHLFTCFDDS
jgi:hypothetical protein